MSKTIKRNIIITAIACLMLYIFSGCNVLSPLYSGDIRVKLKGRNAEIVIKERENLMASFAEIYYIDDKQEVLLGRVVSGEDGFSGLESGLYSVDNDESTVTIELCNSSDKISDPSKWEKTTYELPPK